MKKMIHPALLVLVGAMITASLPAQDLLPGSALDPGQAENLKANVLPTGTSIGGEERPELGRAIADSLSAGLLRRGVRVFGPDREGSDMILESRLVGESGFYHFTLKKVDPGSGEVLGIHEVSRGGGLEVVFPMVVQALQDMHGGDNVPEAEKAMARAAQSAGAGSSESFPAGTPTPLVEHSQKRFADAVAAEVARRENERVAREREAARKMFEKAQAAQVPKSIARAPEKPRRRFSANLVREQVGTILAVNSDWRFCIIEPSPGSDMEIADILETLYVEDSKQPYAKLIVTRQASGDAYVATYGTKKPNRRLFPGEPVYAWVAQRMEF